MPEQIQVSVGGIRWTYTFTRETFRVEAVAYKREVPWALVQHVGVGHLEDHAMSAMLAQVLVAYRPPGASKNKLISSNVHPTSPEGQHLLLRLQQWQPHLWRGVGPLNPMRAAMGISNAPVVIGVVVAIVVLLAIAAALSQL